MVYSLPTVEKEAVALSHFPTKHQAFIFRACEYVPMEKIAKVLKTDIDNNKFTSTAEIFADGNLIEKTELLGRFFIMKDNLIVSKSKTFALRIIKLYKYLCNEKKEYVMSKQILRSGTSIGANIREAVRGQSKADFYAKLHISLKEADETAYWLELLNESGYIKGHL